MQRILAILILILLTIHGITAQNKTLDTVWHLTFGSGIEDVTAQLKQAGYQVTHRNQNFENSETVLSVEWSPIFGRTAQVIQIVFQGGRFSKLRVLYPSSGSDPRAGDMNYFDVQGSIDQQFFKGKPIPHLRNGAAWIFPDGGKIYLGQIIPSIIVAIVER